MSRTSLKSFKQKALKQPGVKEAYDELTPAYRFRRQLVALRQSAGMTQEQIAEKLHTNKSNISRLESVNSEISPKLSTIVDNNHHVPSAEIRLNACSVFPAGSITLYVS